MAYADPAARAAYHREYRQRHRTTRPNRFPDSTWNEQGDCWNAPDDSLWGAFSLINRQRRQPGETRFSESAMWGTRLHEFTTEVDSFGAKPIKGRIRMLVVSAPPTLTFRPYCQVWHLGDAAAINAMCVEHIRKRRLRDKARMKQLHKQDEKKKVKGKNGEYKWWFSRRYAAKYIKKSPSTIDRLAADGNLHPRRLETWNGDFDDYYSKSDLDVVLAAEQALASGPVIIIDTESMQDANLDIDDTVSRETALENFSGCEHTLNKLLPEDGKVLCKGMRSDGRPCNVMRIKKDALKKITDYFQHPTIPEAAKELGVDRRGLDDLVERHLLSVVPDPFGYQRYKRIHKDDVARLKQQRGADDISTDKEGKRHLPQGLATERNSNATPKVLYKYRNKPCPQLGGDILHAKQFPLSADVLLLHQGKGNRDETWKWEESDVMRLRPAKVGKPGQEAAKAARLAAEAAKKVSPPAPPKSGNQRITELGIEVHFNEKKVVGENGKVAELGRSEVQWHIFRVVLAAYPNRATVDSIWDEYPGEKANIARRMSTNLLNNKLLPLGVRIKERLLIKLSKSPE